MSLPKLEILSTARLCIREVDPCDLADLQAINGDEEVTRFLPYATWASKEDAHSWLARMQALADAGTGRQFVIELKPAGPVIGTILLFKYDATSSRAELGYVLGRSYWRRGLMTEALRGLCTAAFRDAGLRRLEAEVNPANGPSNKLLQTLGFVHEGVLRQRWMAKGVAYDTNVYGALATDWLRDVNSSGSSHPSRPA